VKRSPEASAADRRVATLLVRHDLDPAQGARLCRFLAVLADNPHAPTSVRDPAAAVDVHLADSLAGLPVLDEVLCGGAPPRAVDIGSGAGLPGIPLAVARAGVHFDLTEATGRKCQFLVETVQAVEVHNAEVRCARVEELPGQGLRETHGVAVARAVAPLATLVEYAAPLLVQGGTLIAWKGRRDRAEEEAGASAARQVGLEPAHVQPVRPYEESRNRHLYLYQKVRPCPARFPRRAGTARRRPLA